MAPLIFDGAGTIAGLQAGGLPDSSVTSADIANGAITAAKIGYAGAILQVVQTVKTDTFVTAGSATDVAVTGLSVSITPSSSSSKILVICNLSVASQNSQGAAAKIRRGGTAISVATAAGSRSRSSFAGNAYREGQGGSIRSLNVTYLDSPATTSATTYDVVVSSLDTGTYVNRSETDADNSDHLRTCSYITVMEVAG